MLHFTFSSLPRVTPLLHWVHHKNYYINSNIDTMQNNPNLLHFHGAPSHNSHLWNRIAHRLPTHWTRCVVRYWYCSLIVLGLNIVLPFHFRKAICVDFPEWKDLWLFAWFNLLASSFLCFSGPHQASPAANLRVFQAARYLFTRVLLYAHLHVPKKPAHQL